MHAVPFIPAILFKLAERERFLRRRRPVHTYLPPTSPLLSVPASNHPDS